MPENFAAISVTAAQKQIDISSRKQLLIDDFLTENSAPTMNQPQHHCRDTVTKQMNVKSVLCRHPGRFIKSIKCLSKIAENKQQITLYQYHL
ncbi:MAG: hypothetical protein ACYTDW_03750 [Planctomycetota bacterium]|jgi:predicted GTPase